MCIVYYQLLDPINQQENKKKTIHPSSLLHFHRVSNIKLKIKKAIKLKIKKAKTMYTSQRHKIKRDE